MRKRNWLSHTLTLLTVAAAAHIAGDGTANAARTVDRAAERTPVPVGATIPGQEAAEPLAKKPATHSYGVDASALLKADQVAGSQTGFTMDGKTFTETAGAEAMALVAPDWVTRDECDNRFETGLWYKNKFSWCLKARVTQEIHSATDLRLIGDYSYTLIIIGKGHNGQRRIDLEIETQEWDEHPRDIPAWTMVRPGLVDRFYPACVVKFPGSLCGYSGVPASDYVMFPIMVDSVHGFSLEPTTSQPKAGDVNPQDLKGYYEFRPTIMGLHTGGLTVPDEFYVPDNQPVNFDFRCDSASYTPGTGGCVFTNVVSYLQFDCSPTSPMWESACFIKDAFEDITRTYPGAHGTWVPGEHGGNRGALTRNYHKNNGIPNASRSKVQRACRANWGRGYTWRDNRKENECDEYPFAATYQNATTTDGSMPRSFAVRPVLNTHNNLAGNALKAFYANDRVLDSDEFFVKVVGSSPPWVDPTIDAPKLTAPADGVTSTTPVMFTWLPSGPAGNPNTRFTVRVEDADTRDVLATHTTTFTHYTPDLETWRTFGEAGDIYVVISGTGTGATYTAAALLTVGDHPGVPTIMVVGDSISQGFEGDYTWRYRLKQHLTSTGQSVNFVGPYVGTHHVSATPPPPGVPTVDGRYGPNGDLAFDSEHFAVWGKQAAQAKSQIAPQVDLYEPDYLLVELGFNDLAWGVSSPDGTVSNVRQLVENARAMKPDIRVLVANVVHRTPLPNLPGLPTTINLYNGKLAAAIPTWSTPGSPVSLVDIDSLYSPSSDTYDGLHPNGMGEYKIAVGFANALRARFGMGGAFGSVPPSMPVFVPAAPTTLDAAAVPAGIQVTWSHSFGAGGYNLYSRNVTVGESFSLTPVAAESITLTWVVTGHRYEYYVVPVRGNAQGPASPTDGVVANPQTAPGPTNTSVIPGSGYVDLIWNRPTGAFSETIHSYKVFYVDQSAGGGLQDVAPTGTSLRLNGLTNGHRYIIAVASINAAGEGLPAGAPAVIPGYGRPNPPVLQAALMTSPTDAALSWTGAPGVAGYYTMLSNWYDGSPPTIHPFMIEGTTHTAGWLFPADRYEFCIIAANGSLMSSASNCLRTHMPPPQLLSARILNETTVELNWTEVPAASKYQIYRRDVQLNTPFFLVGTDTGTNRQIGSLTLGPDRYQWYVVAVSWTETAVSPPSNIMLSQL